MTQQNDRQNQSFTFDALLPAQVALKAEDIGVKKANLGFTQKILLSILAGAFIAFASDFYTITMVDTADKVGFGLSKFIGGLAFSLGLILVIIAGAELFTGNNLKVMAFASGKLTMGNMLYNWLIVYLGNFIGSVVTAYGIYLTGQYQFAGGEVGLLAMKIANAKCSLPFFTAMMRGIYCNVFVCLAVWLCFSARSNTDKVMSIIFPITAFVASGFEHCVANMYFIPVGLILKADKNFLHNTISAKMTSLNLTGFAINLSAVTIGNIIGGGVLVGVIYWLIYRGPQRKQGLSAD